MIDCAARASEKKPQAQSRRARGIERTQQRSTNSRTSIASALASSAISAAACIGPSKLDLNQSCQSGGPHDSLRASLLQIGAVLEDTSSAPARRWHHPARDPARIAGAANLLVVPDHPAVRADPDLERRTCGGVLSGLQLARQAPRRPSSLGRGHAYPGRARHHHRSCGLAGLERSRRDQGSRGPRSAPARSSFSPLPSRSRAGR
ncbi:hypothetical protein ACVW1A_006947 [Bradyrhizobium sp. LB1.3]